MTARPERLSITRKKRRLLRAYLARRPVWCAWQVTYRCSFRCRICGYWQEHHTPEEELSVEEFARGADNLARAGSLLINLAGGEPFLRQDLAPIVEVLARSHFPFVTTNGWHIRPRRAREVWAAGLWGVSVSIDYPDAPRHDAQRGIPGAFDEAVRALQVFRDTRTAAHQRVNLMAVLTADNQDHVEGVVALARHLGVNFMIQPYGALKTGDRSHLVDRPVAEELLRVHRRFPNFVSNPRFLARFDEASNGGVGDCQAGVSFFNIDERGDVSPCVELRRKVVVGNMLADDPREIARRLRRYRPRNNCRACWYNCRGEMESLYSMRGILAAMPNFWLKPGSSLGRPSGR